MANQLLQSNRWSSSTHRPPEEVGRLALASIVKTHSAPALTVADYARLWRVPANCAPQSRASRHSRVLDGQMFVCYAASNEIGSPSGDAIAVSAILAPLDGGV